MYYSISSETNNNNNYYQNFNTNSVYSYNTYDYPTDTWPSIENYKSEISYSQSYQSNEKYSNNIYIQVNRKSYKRSSKFNHESNKRVKQEPLEIVQNHQIYISPSTSSSLSSSSSTNEDLYCESLFKAYQSGSISKSRYKRLIANERERKRMHGLNVAFENLRSVLPNLGSNKQFSKYETLQMAKSYISALRDILLTDSLNENDKCF